MKKPALREVANQSVLNNAFQRVKENRGCAGVDGITLEKFEKNLKVNTDELRKELLTKSYRPLPLLRILVDKGNGEARAISIPAVRDRVAQTAVLTLIGPLFEAEFEECSYAYRKGRSVKQVVYKIREYYEDGYVWVVGADIDVFFDSVDHDILIKKVKRVVKDKEIVRLIDLWIRAEVWDGKSVKCLEKGISQGSVISPVLANLFLDTFDEELMRKGYKLVRFSDDFIILSRQREEAVNALQLSDRVLERLSLELDKAEIVNFDQGFEFLGVTFLKSLAMVPFDKPKREKKILHYPRPLNMPVYFLKKNKGW
ncbi:MAG: reverse transcriptase domain-containing protein [Candidatus Scalindua sp.]|nr:reverse transcriptase domain-containing protein [Candidatus Scalindua sp.]